MRKRTTTTKRRIIQRLSTFSDSLNVSPHETESGRSIDRPLSSKPRFSINPKQDSFRLSSIASKSKSERTTPLLQCLRSPQWEILMAVLTVISLVAEDIRILFLGVFDDIHNAKIFSGVYIIMYAVMCFIFLVELVLRMCEDRTYFDISYLKPQPATKKCTFACFWATLSRARNAFSILWLYDFLTVVTMLIEVLLGIFQTLNFFSAAAEEHDECRQTSLKGCDTDGLYAPLPFFEDENSSTLYLQQVTAVDIFATDPVYEFEANLQVNVLYFLLKVIKFIRIVARIGRVTSKTAALCAPRQARSRYVLEDTPVELPVIGQSLGESVTQRFMMLMLFTLVILSFMEMLTDLIVDGMATCTRKTRLEPSVLLANAHIYGIANLTSPQYEDSLTRVVDDLMHNSSLCINKLRVLSGVEIMATPGYLCSNLFTATTVICSQVEIKPGATPLPANNITKPPWLGHHTSFAQRSVYQDAVWRSVGGLVTTVVVLALLALGSLMLVLDASRLVLWPLGTMMRLVQGIQKVPLKKNKVSGPSDNLETTLLINRIR